jgi:FAD/FMN-containing dehydrogenase
MTFVQGDPGALLFVEYYGETREELTGKLDGLQARLTRQGIGTAFTRAVTPEEQQRIWKVRKAGMALLLGMIGDGKPIAGIEDTAVAPERLAEYLKRLDGIVRSHGAEAAYGTRLGRCIHVGRSSTSSGTPRWKLRAIAEQVSDLVMSSAAP